MGLRLTDSKFAIWQSWAVPASFAAVAVVLELADCAAALRYERSAIATGEAWRLVTGHWVHLGWTHLAMNLAGLLLVWLLVGAAFGPLTWLAIALAGTLLVDAGFWWLTPSLGWYVGLSGLLHVLLVAGALSMAVRDGHGQRIEALVLLALVAGKIAWEQVAGPMPGSEHTAGGPVVVDAHLFGALAGIVTGGLCLIYASARGRD